MTSPCPNKELCGSCGWSHIPYEKQLEQKRSDINSAFRLKGIDDLECTTILSSPITEHYRNRMDFVIDFEKRVGLRQKGKWWRVIDNHPCFLGSEAIEELYSVARTWVNDTPLTAFDRKAHHGFLRYAVVRSSTLGQSMVIVITSAPADAAEEALAQTELERLASQMPNSTVLWGVNHTISDVSVADEYRTISGNGYIEEEVRGVRFRVSPNAFFQTNPHAAPLLLGTVLDAIGDASQKTIVDLYCGTGFFGIAAAKTLSPAKVVGAEIVEQAIADAKINAELNEVQDRIEWYAAKTEEFDWTQFSPDLVILDPPRSGMHDAALADVMRYAPQEIVYISCSYKNFAREMVQLRSLYDVASMTAIDMFPHTPHVELVTKLVKKST